MFYGIWISTALLQALIVEFGYIAFHVAKGGLEPKFWLLSMGLGACELIVQQIINVLFRLGQRVKFQRNLKRSRQDGQLSTRRLVSTEYPRND